MEKDGLQEYLDSLERHDHYQIIRVLKESPFEITQLVTFPGENGSALGPFVRKIIKHEKGLGEAYTAIYSAQQAGQRFKYLPQIFECYRDEEHLFVIMELVPGETLYDLTVKERSSLTDLLSAIEKLCDAASELHESFDPPLIHRDITPDNVLVSERGITLIDLGIAREYDPEASRDTVQFGTRAYAPPEQFGFGQTDERSDVYSIGKVLKFCVHACNNIDYPTDRLQALNAVITKATALDPDRRYASASQMKVALQASLENKGSSDPASSDQSASLKPNTTIATTPPAPESLITTVPAPVTPAAPPSNSSSLTRRIPNGIGIAWNIIIIFAWVLLFITSTGCTFAPLEDQLAQPLWFRALEFYGLVLIPSTPICFYLLDRRRINERFPKLRNLGLKKTWWITVLGIIAIWIVVYATSIIFNISV